MQSIRNWYYGRRRIPARKTCDGNTSGNKTDGNGESSGHVAGGSSSNVGPVLDLRGRKPRVLSERDAFYNLYWDTEPHLREEVSRRRKVHLDEVKQFGIPERRIISHINEVTTEELKSSRSNPDKMAVIRAAIEESKVQPAAVPVEDRRVYVLCFFATLFRQDTDGVFQ